MKTPILVTRSSMPPLEEYIDEIKELWESHWLTNMGDKYIQLEEKLEEYLEMPNISLFTNGHMALESILTALNVKGEIITTPFTFVSTSNAIVRTGSKPVFCDIKMDDYTMDPDKIEALITPETVAILPVHVYGHICDVEAIEKIAKKHNLKVIYDAAHAFGVKRNGVNASKFGDASMFSFHATKVFNTIEGGAVTFQDPNLKATLHNIKNFGIVNETTVEYIGGNSKMNEFQAAMGICNLRHLDMEIEKRKKVYETYMNCFEGVAGLKTWKVPENLDYNYSYFPILFEEEGMRDKIYDVLKEQDIYSRKYFYPLVNDYDCYKTMYDSKDTPNAKYVAERILTIPFFADLTEDAIVKISDIIKHTLFL